jgi:6,7-dimethyl-8-ribityllumazine synthase
MVRTIEGQLTAQGCSFGIVVTRWNSIVTKNLLDGALDCLRRHGARENDITVVHCPGAFEIPHIAQQLARSGQYDGVICLGAIIRGETPHFDYLAAQVTRGIGQVPMDTGVPVAYGVLTTDNLAQALERAGAKAGNKGWEAALTAIELVQISRQLTERKKGKG